LYREFYNLEEKPFALLPDPRFLYLGSSHREALAHLLYGVEAGEGFIEVIGQVGTGKTTLCRTLLDRFAPNVHVAFIFNPSQSELELLQGIAREFGLATEGRGRSELVNELNEFLLKTRAAERRAVLVIDEAQNLPRDVLEQLRLLSNLETEREKLLQIVLIGQPELEENLSRSDLRQLRQRITVRWDIRPLDRAETEDYVSHRLRVAGRRGGGPLFTSGAMNALYRASKGTPRLINAIADRALLAGYAARRERINGRIVKRAIREMVNTGAGRQSWRAVALWAGAPLLCAAVAGGALYVHPEWLPRFGALSVATALPEEGYTAVAESPDQNLQRLAPALLARTAEQSASQALARILQLWGISAELPPSIAPSSMAVVLKGVSNLRLNPDFTTFAEIRKLDQPVILEFEPRAGELRYAVLHTLQGELAGVSAGDENFLIRTSTLNRYWTGRAMFAWRNFESLAILTPGDARPGVRLLQNALTRLGYMAPGDPSAEYDERTELAVRKFQEGQGLPGTGELGFKSMISLYHALDELAQREESRTPYGGPLLRRGAGAPSTQGEPAERSGS
jgi:general secretion pathway protein A